MAIEVDIPVRSGVPSNYYPLKQPNLYWLFQLDDEPNLYLGNGCFTKHPFKFGWLSGTRYRYVLNGTVINGS